MKIRYKGDIPGKIGRQFGIWCLILILNIINLLFSGTLKSWTGRCWKLLKCIPINTLKTQLIHLFFKMMLHSSIINFVVNPVTSKRMLKLWVWCVRRAGISFNSSLQNHQILDYQSFIVSGWLSSIIIKCYSWLYF